MSIRTIKIENYRSVKSLSFDLGPVNATIGPNNSGKSNILRALNAILGETWPTRPFTEKDLHKYDPNAVIAITVLFDAPLLTDSDVHGFILRYSLQEEVDYLPVDASGNPCTWPGGRIKRVSRDMRNEVALLYLGPEREADKQLRSTPWTLYGRLLKQIEGSIQEQDKSAFVQKVTEAAQDHLRTALDPAQAIIDDFVRRQTGLDVQLDFRLLHPMEVLKNVRPYVLDSSMTHDPEDVGAGVQSALAVAIAKAYADIVRRPLILAIEEPELYLHPHGCRHFYRLLRELSEHGLQIIYTTHERSFVSAGDFKDIHIVRKAAGETTVRSGSTLNLGTSQDRLRLQSKFNERLNEVFFASCVVLVEGDPDEIACKCALEAQGLELDRQSISVIALGGNQEIPTVAELLSGLGIPTIALIDGDPGNAQTAALRTRIEEILGPENTFLTSPNLEGLFNLPRKPSRVEAMTFFPSWSTNTASMIPQVYRDLAARISQ